MDIRVHIRCTNGHEQVIEIDQSLGHDYAVSFAGLFDCTHPAYKHALPPVEDPNSLLGKCGLCRARITATVETVA